ncbi:MAG: SsrA-binding protein [Candidatus Acidiferrales bacterium]
MPKPKRKPAEKKPAVAKPGLKIVAENRTVPYKYHVLERTEAGLVLTGGEVKALREGRAKCELALVKGKKTWDRRDTIRQRTAQREIDQELKSYR